MTPTAATESDTVLQWTLTQAHNDTIITDLVSQRLSMTEANARQNKGPVVKAAVIVISRWTAEISGWVPPPVMCVFRTCHWR